MMNHIRNGCLFCVCLAFALGARADESSESAETPAVTFEVTSSGMALHAIGTRDDTATGTYDVYLAYAPEGETLPSAMRVGQGYENDLDTRFNVMLDGLKPETTYVYSIYALTTGAEKVGETSGTFTTGKIYYVNGTSGDDTKDGLTEATAVKTPEQAMTLALATKAEGHEIRIAAGRYVMSATLLPTTRFALVGMGESAADVVLDANYAVDQRIVQASESKSSKHISLMNLTFANARMETFNCYANWTYPGAGVRIGIAGGNQTLGNLYTWVSNCTFTACTNVNTGAGALFLHGGSMVTDCRFEDNHAGNGANNGCGSGGAVVVQAGGGQTLFRRCEFLRNTSAGNGGVLTCGVYSGDLLSTNILGVVLSDCHFSGNSAAEQGGVLDGKIVLAKGCTFEGNSAKTGAVYGRGWSKTKFPWATPYLDCTFRENRAAYHSGGFCGYNTSVAPELVFSNCTFAANSSAGGCSLFLYVDLDLQDCTFFDNENDALDDVKTTYGNWGFDNGLGCAANVTARDCVFSNNVARGTALLSLVGGCKLDMDACSFIANELRPADGKSDQANRCTLVLPQNCDGSVLRNTLFANNTNYCGYGAALNMGTANATNDNLTIVGNRCYTDNANGWVAAGIYISDKRASVFRNCLVLDNVNLTKNVLQNFYQWGQGTFINCLEDGEQLLADGRNALSGITREGTNYKVSSLEFKNAANGDWTPVRKSVAKDAGLMLEWMTADATDILGNRRVYDTAPDIGAFENQEPVPGFLLLVR